MCSDKKIRMCSSNQCPDARTHDVAEAIYRSCHENWVGHIPYSVDHKYHRMAAAAIRVLEK